MAFSNFYVLVVQWRRPHRHIVAPIINLLKESGLRDLNKFLLPMNLLCFWLPVDCILNGWHPDLAEGALEGCQTP